MKKYVIYDSNGVILRTGVCPASMLQMQADVGETVIEGTANDINDKVVGGVIVRKSEEEISAIRDKMKVDPKARLISEKMHEIARRQAIDELTKEGKI